MSTYINSETNKKKSKNDFHFLGPITNSVIDGIIAEIKKKKTKEKIMRHIVDPLLCDLTTRYYPYLITITIILVLMVLLLVSILIMMAVQRCDGICD
jgi:hypothetical protein